MVVGSGIGTVAPTVNIVEFALRKVTMPSVRKPVPLKVTVKIGLPAKKMSFGAKAVKLPEINVSVKLPAPLKLEVVTPLSVISRLPTPL